MRNFHFRFFAFLVLGLCLNPSYADQKTSVSSKSGERAQGTFWKSESAKGDMQVQEAAKGGMQVQGAVKGGAPEPGELGKELASQTVSCGGQSQEEDVPQNPSDPPPEGSEPLEEPPPELDQCREGVEQTEDSAKEQKSSKGKPTSGATKEKKDSNAKSAPGAIKGKQEISTEAKPAEGPLKRISK